MDSIRQRPEPPWSRAWILLWISQFISWGCLSLICVAAIRPKSLNYLSPQPPHAVHFGEPLLVAVVAAFAFTWQAWRSHKNGKPLFASQKKTTFETKTVAWMIGIFLMVGVLLLECVWAFSSPESQIDWPLLSALDLGFGAGYLGTLGAFRMLPEPRVTLVTALRPKSEVFPVTEPQTIPMDCDARRPLPEPLVRIASFLCAFAMICLSFAPGLSYLSLRLRDWPLTLFFGGLAMLTALTLTAPWWIARQNASWDGSNIEAYAATQKASKNAKDAFAAFTICGLMSAFVGKGWDQNWPILLSCLASAFTFSRLQAWIVTSAPMSTPTRTPAVSKKNDRPKWLPGGSSAQVAPTEITLKAHPFIQIGLGLFAIVGMGGVTLTAALITFAPQIFGDASLNFGFRFMCFFLFLILSGFTYVCLGALAPQTLCLRLDTRTYMQHTWKPIPDGHGMDGCLYVFCSLHFEGSMDEDIAGVGVKKYQIQDNIRYGLSLIWKDAARPPRILRSFLTPEQARQAMMEAASTLGVPALDKYK